MYVLRGSVIMADNKTGTKLIAPNKKARHDYFVLDTYEAGIELFGTEVKSIRRGGVNLKDSYCCIEKGEMFAEGIHISPYEQGNIFNREPLRKKKLLMHKKEINKLLGTVSQQGLTLVHSRCTSRVRGSRSRSDCAKERSSTTSATLPPRKKPTATSSAR